MYIGNGSAGLGDNEDLERTKPGDVTANTSEVAGNAGMESSGGVAGPNALGQLNGKCLLSTVQDGPSRKVLKQSMHGVDVLRTVACHCNAAAQLTSASGPDSPAHTRTTR
jgi:hypothetical protein